MKACLLSSGSKGNSCLVYTDSTKILIDLGTSSQYVCNELDKLGIKPSEIDAILVSHTHVDHINGIKSFIRKYHTKIYVTEVLKELLEKEIGSFDYELYEDKKAIINDLEINIIKTSHDAEGSIGFIINEGKKSLVYITDTGYINRKNIDITKNKSIYLIESNHDEEMLMNGSYPYMLKQRVLSDTGHLSNKSATSYLKKVIGPNTKYVILAHISENNNTYELAYNNAVEELDGIIDKEKIIVAYQNKGADIIEL
jgi:phosphoribosyl 1,2-cyclic phosphodiesterase